MKEKLKQIFIIGYFGISFLSVVSLVDAPVWAMILMILNLIVSSALLVNYSSKTEKTKSPYDRPW